MADKFNVETSEFAVFNGDIDGDGAITRKDLNRCSVMDVVSAIKDLIDTDTDTDTISVEELSIDGNIITVTPGNGSEPYTIPITHPPQVNLESDGIVVSGAGVWDLVNGVITYPTVNDFDQSPAPSIEDFVTIPALVSLLTSPPRPEFQGSGATSASYNSDTNLWTIHSDDTDTKCTYVSLPNGQVEKTATTYTNGTVTNVTTTVFGIPRLTASELCALIAAELETNLAKAAQVHKILQKSISPIGPVCIGQVESPTDGKLYWNADGTEKLEVFDSSDNCLKPYNPLYNCMCIELEDGRFMTLASVSPQVWVEKEGVDYLQIACGLVENTDALQKLSQAIDTDTNTTYELGELIDTDPNDGVKKLVLTGSDGSDTCVLIPDSTELPDIDTDTTYTLQVVDNSVVLVGSDGSTSGGNVFIQTFDENLVGNDDGSYTFTDDDGSIVTISRPRTADEICQAVLTSLTLNPVKLEAYKALIDTDTVVTYEFGAIVDEDPSDGVKKLVLNGSNGSTTCVVIADSTELPDEDTDTTYTLQVVDNTLTLIGSNGSVSGGDVFIQTFDESFSSNTDGSHTFTDDDGSTVTIPRPRTADELCQAVLASLTANSTKLAAYKAIINESDVTVSAFTFDAGVATITLTNGTTFTDTANGPVVNTYIPETSGDVIIPLTDGGSITLSGLVSPVDVDFTSTTVTVDENNDFVITYFDENGDVITTSTLPGNDVLGGLSLDADGCTLVGTLDDGTNVSVPLCDLISNVTFVNNVDGSTTYTHESGDGTQVSWTTSTPLTQSDGTIVPKDCVQPELVKCTGALFRKGDTAAHLNNSFGQVVRFTPDPDDPLGCRPVFPCPNVIEYTVNPKGDLWYNNFGTPVRATISSNSELITGTRTGDSTETLNDNALQALFATIGTNVDSPAIQNLEWQITNTDCVPIMYDLLVSVSPQAVLAPGQENSIEMRFSLDPSNTAPLGANSLRFDTTTIGTVNSNFNRTSYGNMFTQFRGLLVVGGSVTISINTLINFRLPYVSNPDQLVSFNNMAGDLRVDRVRNGIVL